MKCIKGKIKDAKLNQLTETLLMHITTCYYIDALSACNTINN